MKHRTLFGLAVAAALASGAASAETFRCTTAADLSITDCAQVSPAMGEPSVTHDTPVPRPPQNISAVPDQPHETITVIREPGAWPETEPSVSKYHYYYGPWIYYHER